MQNVHAKAKVVNRPNSGMKPNHLQKFAVGSTHTRVTNLSLSGQHLQISKCRGLCSILKRRKSSIASTREGVVCDQPPFLRI